MESFINGEGMKMLPVSAGTFLMGGGREGENPDALPAHPVTLTENFFIAEEPVTLAQFERYERERNGKTTGKEQFKGFLIGVSYEEASGYVSWLSEKEQKSYHLPTEAEWEYTARQRNQIPADRMCDPRIREWCYDWFAPYDDLPATDPAGPENGMFRCVRGGYLDNPERYQEYPMEPYYRCALPPGYRHQEEDIHNDFGKHPIGFRVVMGRLPKPKGTQCPPWLCVGVRQEMKDIRFWSPLDTVPYFRKRYLFPVPPDNCTAREIRCAGFSPVCRHHHHSPAFTAAPNGDLLYSVYSTYHEYDAQSGLLGMRFRFGEDQWSYPDVFLNPVGVNDHAPLFHTSPDGRIYHFWGWQQLDHAYPFQYVVSNDNGEHWSEAKFPLFRNHAEWVCRQPVNTCIDASDGTFYLVADASSGVKTDDTGVQRVGSASVLWRSRDGLKTWENPKARTAGRHTTAVEKTDGSILAMGGKNTDIDGFMPAAITRDGGDSYEIYKTCFPALNSGQRPSILRLRSGRLVFCGDYQTKKNVKPEVLKDKAGSYVAWSDDDGETWTFKQLWGTQKRKQTPELFGGASTLGYSVMKQSPDGLIHIVCSNVHPLLHLCFNESWLTSEESQEPPEAELMASMASKLVTERSEYQEHYPGGQLRCRYHGGVADDGRFLLDGPETFWYEDGRIMTEGTYVLGKKTGCFTYYDCQGYPVKRFTYPEIPGDELEEWFETFWPGTNQVKTRAFFRNRKAQGKAVRYGRNGEILEEVYYHDGKLDDSFDTLET